MKNGDMNKILKDGFPSVPEIFHLRVEETLRSIEKSEEQETMKGTFKKNMGFHSLSRIDCGHRLCGRHTVASYGLSLRFEQRKTA